MVLLGGVQSLAGPVIGAVAYVGLSDWIARTFELWRLVLGVGIVLLAVAFRGGLAGIVRRRSAP